MLIICIFHITNHIILCTASQINIIPLSHCCYNFSTLSLGYGFALWWCSTFWCGEKRPCATKGREFAIILSPVSGTSQSAISSPRFLIRDILVHRHMGQEHKKYLMNILSYRTGTKFSDKQSIKNLQKSCWISNRVLFSSLGLVLFWDYWIEYRIKPLD